MFESEIRIEVDRLRAALDTGQPFLSLEEILTHPDIDDAYKQFFHAEVEWWIYQQQVERSHSPYFDFQRPEFQPVLEQYDALCRQFARFDQRTQREVTELAVKVRCNFLLRPQATLRWFVFRGEPTQPAAVIFLRLQYFADYPYLIDGVYQAVAERAATPNQLLSALDFERIVQQVEQEELFDYTPSQFLELLVPMEHFFQTIYQTAGRQGITGIPIAALIIFLHDKSIYPIAEKLQEIAEQQHREFISREEFRYVIQAVLEQVEQEQEETIPLQFSETGAPSQQQESLSSQISRPEGTQPEEAMAAEAEHGTPMESAVAQDADVAVSPEGAQLLPEVSDSGESEAMLSAGETMAAATAVQDTKQEAVAASGSQEEAVAQSGFAEESEAAAVGESGEAVRQAEEFSEPTETLELVEMEPIEEFAEAATDEGEHWMGSAEQHKSEQEVEAVSEEGVPSTEEALQSAVPQGEEDTEEGDAEEGAPSGEGGAAAAWVEDVRETARPEREALVEQQANGEHELADHQVQAESLPEDSREEVEPYGEVGEAEVAEVELLPYRVSQRAQQVRDFYFALLGQPAAGEEIVKIPALRELLTQEEQARIVQELFGGDEKAWNAVVERLEQHYNWKAALAELDAVLVDYHLDPAHPLVERLRQGIYERFL